MALTDYSTTPANNNSAPPNGAPEGMAAASVNNTMRQIMADIKGGVPVMGATNAVMSALDADKLSEGSVVQTLSRSAFGDNAGGTYRVTKLDISTEVTADSEGGVHVPFDSDGTGASGGFVRSNIAMVELVWFGGVGDDSTDNATAVSAWLSYLIATGLAGWVNDGIFLISTAISKAAANGLVIYGTGTLKASGSNRKEMLEFTGVKGQFDFGGVTIDGDNKTARCLEVKNISSGDFGDVYIGPKAKFINAKDNNDGFTVFAVHIQGAFDWAIFEGEIDGVDSSATSGAVTVGLGLNFSSTFWIRNSVVTSASRIRNVKNDNTVLENADGVQCFAPANVNANFTVSPGALFDECKGRGIKSQVTGNSIVGPVIRRSLYDGLIEIDIQRSGGYVHGAQIFHDGVRVDSIINATLNLSPATTQFSAIGNELTVIGSPATMTNSMVAVNADDDTVALQGITIRDNKVKGAVEFLANMRVANVPDVNRVVIDGNWAETIGTSFINMGLFGSNRAQLTLAFTNNSCENGATGATIVASGDLKVESDRNNFNITPLRVLPFNYVISSDAITPKGEDIIQVAPETGTTDDLSTINMENYGPNEFLTITTNAAGDAITLKDGVGLMKLAGDLVLSSINDTAVVRWNGTNVCEVSRSINGA